MKSGNFYNLSFFKSSDLGFRSKIFFLQFLVDILPLGSGSVDPHIFADPRKPKSWGSDGSGFSQEEKNYFQENILPCTISIPDLPLSSEPPLYSYEFYIICRKKNILKAKILVDKVCILETLNTFFKEIVMIIILQYLSDEHFLNHVIKDNSKQSKLNSFQNLFSG